MINNTSCKIICQNVNNEVQNICWQYFYSLKIPKSRLIKVVSEIQSKNFAANLFYNYFGKIYMIGLGYKNFVLNGLLYILVGNCNYIIYNIPSSIRLYCRKNQIYFLSSDKSILQTFISTIQNTKYVNLYKGKGLIKFKNFKFTKLKIGKKQRFA